MTKDAFDRLVADVDYPMTIVTTAAGERRAGCLVGFLTQCSIHPSRMLVCLSKHNYTFRVAADADALAVHFLGRADLALAEVFGGRSGDDTDKFAATTWSPGPAGLPVLEVQRGWFAGRILDRIDLGDHAGYLLEPFAGAVGEPEAPFLAFSQTRWIRPGHEA